MSALNHNATHSQANVSTLFVICFFFQVKELKKVVQQSESHSQRHKAVSLDHAEKGLFENN